MCLIYLREGKKMADLFLGTGRRKTSIATVTVVSGTGKITVNDKDMAEYFYTNAMQREVQLPFQLTSTEGKFDVNADVKGGGTYAQADAMKLAISRALIQIDLNLRPTLIKASCLRRDPREKERKKYGQRGARAKFQFTKR